MTRRLLIPLATLLVAACGEKNDTDGEDTDTDGIQLPDDTFEFDTADEDTEDTPQVADRAFVVTYEGRGTVAPGVRFGGSEALSARWVTDDGYGPPGCIYAREIIDWNRSDESGQDPLRNVDMETECPECTWWFTVVPSNAEEVDRYPWTVDTDTGDTAVPPPDLVEDDELNCDDLVANQGFITPSDIDEDWFAYAYLANIDQDDDLTTGVWGVWIERYGSFDFTSFDDNAASWDYNDGSVSWEITTLPYGYY